MHLITYFRFIECYKKSKGINGKQYDFFNKVLSEKISLIKISQDEKNKLTQEIVSLRNHYVHNGYYIKNNSLKINFSKATQKQYEVNNYVAKTDFEWIFKRTKILYLISIDIIFDEILNYDKYRFNGRM